MSLAGLKSEETRLVRMHALLPPLAGQGRGSPVSPDLQTKGDKISHVMLKLAPSRACVRGRAKARWAAGESFTSAWWLVVARRDETLIMAAGGGGFFPFLTEQESLPTFLGD